MNAEALVGTVLGTCTLQQLVGQGGMGAVYLAQQSRPRRQVAVKVLLPVTTMKPQHLSAFLERFRRETDAAASLEHPNIMPVYEYGERDGLAFLVMPYISGGTLRDVMEREGQLILPKAINYLEQLAAALDFAHARGVIHRDIKPANILLTPEGRLLLTDFGLVKILTEEGQAQVRLTGAGAPVGTPDYMSPEQVMGHEVDGRADLYSLGIILFQMLTATTPFQGETPMQIAAQQLHAQPPSPRRFVLNLPVAAEQVILRALSKRPSDRYANGLELATAFRLSLTSSELLSSPDSSQHTGSFGTGSPGGSGIYSRRGLFDPKWQTSSLPSVAREQNNTTMADSRPYPAQDAPARTSGLLSRTGMFPKVGSGNTGTFPAAPFNQNPATPTGRLSGATGAQVAANKSRVQEFSPSAYAALGDMIPTTPSRERNAFAQSGINQISPTMKPNTDALFTPGTDPGSQTYKLTGPVKVVQVPVAPGRYVTGLLPVPPTEPPPAPENPRLRMLKKVALLATVVFLLLGTLGIWLVRSHSGRTTTAGITTTTAAGTPNMQATMAARATAAAQANTIFSDPLSSNIHNWPEGTSATRAYVFEKGAYHITNLGKEGVAVVVQYTLPNEPMAYQLTMQEIRGDDTSAVNSFGMIFRYNQAPNGGVSTFYSFEVINTPGGNGKYWFYKYNSSSANPWTALWSQNYGSEYHEGHGSNTFKVIANGSSFSFEVNGKVVGKPIVDKSYTSGYVGMVVNLDGTEVAYSNLLITTLNRPKP